LPAEQRSNLPLAGRVAVVTGVSRRIGIGFAIAKRLLRDGADVLIQGWPQHDLEQPWGADGAGWEGMVAELRDGLPEAAGRLEGLPADFAEAAAAATVIDTAVERLDRPDILIANHARSSAQDLASLTVAELDASWAVNVRATLLLVQAFAFLHAEGEAGTPRGRVVLLTSGQHVGPMPDEIPYALTKGALQQITTTLAKALVERGITVNCVNPGATDTGYATDEERTAVARRHPRGRWGQPDDAARLIAWLCSDQARWLTGQTLVSDGGLYLG